MFSSVLLGSAPQQALHNLLANTLPRAEVIILPNREPCIHNRTDEGVKVPTPASGLVSALEPVMRACGGTWIAHGSGTANQETVDNHARIDVPPDAPSHKLRHVWVTEEEQDGSTMGWRMKGCGRCATPPSSGRSSATATGRPTG